MLRSADDVTACRAGDILVMRHATPAVARAARAASGLVCETGGLLDHLAILARELGTPCVTGVRGIVDALESGAEVVIDGTSGWLDAPATPSRRGSGLAPETPSEGTGLVPILQFGRFSPTTPRPAATWARRRSPRSTWRAASTSSTRCRSR